MRRYSPYHSPPRRGYGARGRSPPRRGYGGGREQNNGSLLVRNIPLSCRPEDLRIPFERFGPVRDVYLPKDYYTGEITVVVAAETRKRPEDMRRRGRIRGPSGYDARRSYHGRSRSPRYSSRARHHSRSYSPAPRHRDDYSASPRQRHSGRMRSPRDHSKEHKEDREHRSYSPNYVDANENRAANVHDNGLHDVERSRSPRRISASPPGSRSRSADISPRHSS